MRRLVASGRNVRAPTPSSERAAVENARVTAAAAVVRIPSMWVRTSSSICSLNLLFVVMRSSSHGQINPSTPPLNGYNDCTTCHAKPMDVLSTNHAFDSTPIKAEVNLTLDGRNPVATYNSTTGTCTNTYCHGNGQLNNGTATDGMGPMTCTSCHGGRANSGAGLGGKHNSLHTGIDCVECHQLTVAAGGLTLTNPALHIDKIKQVKFTTLNVTFTNGTCSGTCHGVVHSTFSW